MTNSNTQINEYEVSAINYLCFSGRTEASEVSSLSVAKLRRLGRSQFSRMINHLSRLVFYVKNAF